MDIMEIKFFDKGTEHEQKEMEILEMLQSRFKKRGIEFSIKKLISANRVKNFNIKECMYLRDCSITSTIIDLSIIDCMEWYEVSTPRIDDCDFNEIYDFKTFAKFIIENEYTEDECYDAYEHRDRDV